MRTALFILLFTSFTAAAQSESTHRKFCDALIKEGVSGKDRERGIKLLNSGEGKKCMRHFPDLAEKYFPVKPCGDGTQGTVKCESKDPAFSVQWK